MPRFVLGRSLRALECGRAFRPALAARTLTTMQSPFAPPTPLSDEAKKLAREEERRERQEAMATMLREQTMREVNRSAESHRPDGVSHELMEATDAPSEYGADYTEGKDEWGGPKGKEPTRFGDWERKGRASDF